MTPRKASKKWDEFVAIIREINRNIERIEMHARSATEKELGDMVITMFHVNSTLYLENARVGIAQDKRTKDTGKS